MPQYRRTDVYQAEQATAAGTIQYSMTGGVSMPMTYGVGDWLVTGPDGTTIVMNNAAFTAAFEAIS